ncbi:hypothetical protein, partial [Amycolatopsis sp. NPDC049868]|uniref:hypothetical protein n=1 Tax=Amycolatopsis sp. NPDC049868 TaxID=3363934 RepID=UPI0037A82C3C
MAVRVGMGWHFFPLGPGAVKALARPAVWACVAKATFATCDVPKVVFATHKRLGLNMGMPRSPSPVGGFLGSSQHLMAYVVVSRLRMRSAGVDQSSV